MLRCACAFVVALQVAFPTAQAGQQSLQGPGTYAETAAATPMSPRDRALAAHEGTSLGTCSGPMEEPIQPVRTWQRWDSTLDPRIAQGHRRRAQAIHTGTIRRPETQHLIHMQLAVRRTLRAFKEDGFLSDPERAALLEAFADTGQVLFFATGGRFVRPPVRARIRDTRLGIADARELFGQFVRLGHVHRMLAGPPQMPRKRAALEAEYAQLAAQLYD